MKEAITFLLLVTLFAAYCESKPPVIQEKEVVREVPIKKVVVKWRTHYLVRQLQSPYYPRYRYNPASCSD